ncbi:MAG: Jag N-terminal domain-containing protein [Thermodesulfobacteriota bacterium]
MSNAKMEYKGLDIDEAISNACASLKVKREELEIEIVSTGSLGIFGLGKKKAVIRVSRRGAAPAQATEAAAAKPEVKARPEARPQPEAKAKPEPKIRPEPKAETKPERKKRPPEEEDEGDREEAGGEPLTNEELETIKARLAEMLQLMGCPAQVTASQDVSNKVLLRIDEGDLATITGPEGQTLDGLQYLLRKIVSRVIPKKVVLGLDAGSFRETRRKELEERALALAAEVKATGKSRTIPALSPAERRIVHLALQPDNEIRSRSVGDGVFKKVLIHLPGSKPPGRRRSSRRRGNGGRPRENGNH